MVSRNGKWTVRETSSGRTIRITVWVREELAKRFDEIVERKQLDKSDVLRSAIESFVALDNEERTGMRRKEKLLAQRVFRMLLGVLGPKEVLADVLKMMTRREADNVIAKVRGEVDNG